ncbi:MAG: type II secretion system F family protein [Beijerinckiaceae bacterium]
MFYDLLMGIFGNPRVLVMLLAGVAASATAVALAVPYLEGDALKKRMKAVSIERERIRVREREKLNNGGSLRQQTNGYMQDAVSKLNLQKWVGADTAKALLQQAGFRGRQAEIAFLFFRLVMPILFVIVTGVYMMLFLPPENKSLLSIGGGLIVALYTGLKAPEFYLKNAISKRKVSMNRAFPDALDLLLICVESGMSIEQSFRRVSQEIGSQSVPLAEEFTLATAELSYLSERRQAYENLSLRTDLDNVKSVCTALVQSERYGTPIGNALRVLAQEFRDQRMTEAEKKAAALPPKLTVPMILFFIPALFMAIMGPAMIQIFKWK